jgi:hypothetical protein
VSFVYPTAAGRGSSSRQRAACFCSLLARQRVLMGLDNARSAEHVRPLLPATPGCTAILTSRDSLAGLVVRDGAQRVVLDLLPLTDAVHLLRSLIGDRVEADPAAVQALAVQCACLRRSSPHGSPGRSGLPGEPVSPS